MVHYRPHRTSSLYFRRPDSKYQKRQSVWVCRWGTRTEASVMVRYHPSTPGAGQDVVLSGCLGGRHGVTVWWLQNGVQGKTWWEKVCFENMDSSLKKEALLHFQVHFCSSEFIWIQKQPILYIQYIFEKPSGNDTCSKISMMLLLNLSHLWDFQIKIVPPYTFSTW